VDLHEFQVRASLAGAVKEQEQRPFTGQIQPVVIRHVGEIVELIGDI
jgi:hypothetical protein